jgi:hypothetical protein
MIKKYKTIFLKGLIDFSNPIIFIASWEDSQTSFNRKI